MGHFAKIIINFLILYAIIVIAHKPKIHINYTIWVNDNVDISYSRVFEVPYNSTFYEVMEIAANIDTRYIFNSTVDPKYGHFITEIGNYFQNSSMNLYWFIYIMRNKPNVHTKPPKSLLSNYGVDNFTVKNHYNYLFWLRTYNPSEDF
ncbi:hypothetical protein PVAND_013886 [Polypedilum vanderplanki]|uniref:Uncharacterized protein n=1 Tax=Polypedilum vanderplanki TaxID=319348 RepID=A0A9J6CRZ6_POLVA|nr:hypothetical protein PVAND_013886 [Polypedilum vanderplanki]